MVDSQLVTKFILMCLGLMVLSLAYFIKKWIEGLQSSITNLNTSVSELSKVAAALNKELAVQRVRIKNQAMQIAELRRQRACALPNCPNADEDERLDDLMLVLEAESDSGAHDVQSL